MNQRYTSTAVVDPEPEPWHNDPELFHQPSITPGAKLPHVWLVGSDGHRISTLDLAGKGIFTILTGLAGTHWTAAAEAVGKSLGVPIKVIRIGSPEARDAYGDWARLTAFPEAGCLLIRPDGYIAWRQNSPVTPEAELTTALSSVLARTAHTPADSLSAKPLPATT